MDAEFQLGVLSYIPVSSCRVFVGSNKIGRTEMQHSSFHDPVHAFNRKLPC